MPKILLWFHGDDHVSILLFLTGDHCLRADSKDQTNGFFIAVFKRLVGKKSTGKKSTVTEIIIDGQKLNLTKNHKKRKHKHSPVTSIR